MLVSAVALKPLHWFLGSPRNTRSSLYLEDAATEFQVQGLELDWTIVTWDADLRWRGSDWSFHSFRGAKWTDVKEERPAHLHKAHQRTTHERPLLTFEQCCPHF
jgi:hypothetical protein